MVLVLECVADVNQLAIFEDEEVVLLGQGFEATYSIIVVVLQSIHKSLENRDVWTDGYKTGLSLVPISAQGLTKSLPSAR